MLIEGKTHFYIEMEKPFHELPNITLKDLGFDFLESTQEFLKNHANDEFFMKLARNVSALLVRVFENKILPADSDFIIDKHGNTKWIDFGFWQSVDHAVEVVPELVRLYKWFNGSKPEYAEQLKSEFISLLNKSDKLNSQEKRQIIQAFNKQVREYKLTTH